MEQAEIGAKNGINLINGKSLVHYKPAWWEIGVDLTIGLVRKLLPT